MPNTIEIDGIIGWDIIPSEISAQLKKFKGEPVEILFSSDGGYVSDGLAIFNHIHNYSGETTAIIIGVAASMSSYIPLAANKVIAKSNAVMMIHDPLMGTYGNQKEHEKAAKILGGFANMLSDIYAKKTGKSLAEIREIMEEESFFFGAEMLEAGLVDEIDEIEVSTKKDDTVLDAMLKFEVAAERIKTKPEDYSKIAAYFTSCKNNTTDNNTTFPTPGNPALKNHSQETGRMDINKLKAEYPEVYQQVVDEGKKIGLTAEKETNVAEGKAAGVLMERKRMNDIDALGLPADFAKSAKESEMSAEQTAASYLKAEAVKREKVQENMESDINEPLASDTPAQPKKPETEEKNPVAEYEAAVLKAQDNGKVSRGQAMKSVKLANPKLHAEYINASNQGGQ